jgi:hypothetical protein
MRTVGKGNGRFVRKRLVMGKVGLDKLKGCLIVGKTLSFDEGRLISIRKPELDEKTMHSL